MRPAPGSALAICVGATLLLVTGCVASVGGWDVARLLASEPGLASVPGQRIGDLTPYPALAGGRLVMVVCRFDAAGPISVSGSGPGWNRAWASIAVEALDRGLTDVVLRRVESGLGDRVAATEIGIESIEAPHAEGPAGLGDTLVECDVREDPPGSHPDGVAHETGGVRGRVTSAEIRIRRSLPLITGGIHRATQDEWTGALLHELGHALGFAGHAATGQSVVHREQSVLRGLGRRAMRGEAIPTPNLSALYLIEPGRVLGEAELSALGKASLERALARVDANTARWGSPSGPFASAGDRSARIVWRWSGQGEVSIDFPRWRSDLRDGRPVRAILYERASPSTEREE